MGARAEKASKINFIILKFFPGVDHEYYSIYIIS